MWKENTHFQLKGKKTEICLDSVIVLLSEYCKQLLALTELLKNLNHYFFLLPPGNKVKEQSFFHLHPQSSHKIKGQLFSETQTRTDIYLCCLVQKKVVILCYFSLLSFHMESQTSTNDLGS